MARGRVKNISPEMLATYVTFDRSSPNWSYCKSSQDMPNKQAEGSAYIFNLLNEKGLALLADEVGTGKTIQALSVCAALWKQKPQARILVLAPRNEIAYNWRNEYETFINVHFKKGDDVVKSYYGGEAIHQAQFCNNLYDLVSKVQENRHHFFIGKISSFSSLLGSRDVKKILARLRIKTRKQFTPTENHSKYLEQAREIGSLLNNEIRNQIGQFDLIIIDEAHYFRNSNGDSIKVNVAKKFFGMDNTRLSKKVLLLTATPNHNKSNDIKNIVNYFDPKLGEKDFDVILKSICLRRYRRLSKHDLMKYDYREEEAVKASFEEDAMSELFFALYQKEVVRKLMSEEGNRKNNILEFLEGTEFIPTEIESKDDSADKNIEGKDFKQGKDSTILIKQSGKFREIFTQSPSHPKYNALIKRLFDEQVKERKSNSKKLVFVRRIPSVREIARRVIEEYDTELLERLNNILGITIGIDQLNYKAFNKTIEDVLKDKEKDEGEFDVEQVIEDEGDDGNFVEVGVPESKVLGLFKFKKNNTFKSSHATKFRKRFEKNKGSVFSIFFSPGPGFDKLETLEDLYKLKILYHGENKKISYHYSCLQERLSLVDENSKLNILKFYGDKNFRGQ